MEAGVEEEVICQCDEYHYCVPSTILHVEGALLSEGEPRAEGGQDRDTSPCCTGGHRRVGPDVPAGKARQAEKSRRSSHFPGRLECWLQKAFKAFISLKSSCVSVSLGQRQGD